MMQPIRENYLRRFALTITMLLAICFVAGCASDDNGSSADRPPEEEVSRKRDTSTIPWNRPASWEGSNVGGVNPGLGTR